MTCVEKSMKTARCSALLNDESRALSGASQNNESRAFSGASRAPVSAFKESGTSTDFLQDSTPA
jgi:hypothetical protein